MPVLWIVRWTETKTHFATATKVKKPSVKVLGFYRKGTGIEAALKKADSTEKAYELNKNAKTLDAFVKAAGEFVTAKTAYLRVLEAAVVAEPAGVDRQTYLNGVNVLKTELTALDSSLKSRIASMRSGLAGATNTEALAANLFINLEGACDRATAFIAKQKSTPSAAAFNTGILTATRDINQCIGNVNKLKAKGFHFDHEEPTNLFILFRPWAGGQRQLKTTATRAEILREVGAVEQAVAGVKRWAAGEH